MKIILHKGVCPENICPVCPVIIGELRGCIYHI